MRAGRCTSMSPAETALDFRGKSCRSWSIAGGVICLHLQCNTNSKPLFHWQYNRACVVLQQTVLFTLYTSNGVATISICSRIFTCGSFGVNAHCTVQDVVDPSLSSLSGRCPCIACPTDVADVFFKPAWLGRLERIKHTLHVTRRPDLD